MAKRIEPRAIAHLPQLTIGGTLALAAKLLAAAKAEKKLPADLAKTTKRMKQAHDAMAQAKRARVIIAPEKNVRARLRRDEVTAWSGLQQLLTAWSKLPAEVEQVGAARRLAAALFTGEPPFARRRFEVAWKETDERLKLMKEHNLEEAIEALGATAFIEHIVRTHRASGDHLGITHRDAVTQDAQPTMRQLSEELRGIMREYVVQVTGYAVADRKAKQLGNRLLAPIGEWREVRTTRKRPTAAPASEVAPAPAPSPVVETVPAPASAASPVFANTAAVKSVPIAR